MQKKNLVGTYIGGIPVHYAFDEGLHELATPAGKELKASNLTIRGACLAEPLPNAIIFSYIVTSTIKLPTGLVGSIFWTAFCADSTIFTLSKQHGNTTTDIGFFRFEAENSFGSVEFAQDEELSPGDKLLIKAPISLNGNISFAWTIKALNLPVIITTPEACFQIASDGIIVNYDHNGGNEVIIPATINKIPVIGVASTASNDEAYDDELLDFLETNVVTTSLSLDDIKEKWREVFPIERLDLSQTSITIIEPRTYRKLGIIDLILPKTLVDIGASAFEYNNIDYLRPFPVSLLQIREKAFYHNKIGGTSYSFAVDGFAFQGSGATNVKLASSVKAIPDQAFYNRGGGVGNYCTVTSIQLGNNVALGFDVLGEFPDPGFKTTYDNGGKLGGIYQKNGSSWSRVSSETLDV